jgi:hypothetical protein
MKFKYIGIAAAMLISLGLVQPASAGLIVDWDRANNSTGVDESLVIGAASNPSGFIQNWNPAGEVMSSSINAGYGNQPLYATLQTEGSDALVGHENAFIDGDANATFIGSLWYGIKGGIDSNATQNTVTGLFSIKAADFLAGGVNPGDTISSMSLFLTGQRANSFDFTRFAVKSGGQWYLSSENYSSFISDGGQLSNAGTTLAYTGGDWASFSPSTAASNSLMTSVGLTYNVAASSLNDIGEVGFFFEGQHGAGTSRARFRPGIFQVETMAVPEPTTMLLSLLGVCLVYPRRSRS